MTMRQIAWDTETTLIGPGQIAPKLICLSLAWREDGETKTELYTNSDPQALLDTFRWLFTSPEVQPITHNGAFDYGVVAAAFPELLPEIFDLLESGRATDTLWREKLLNVSDHGRLDMRPIDGGGAAPLRYSLAALTEQYLGVDISEAKKADAWRLHYGLLDGWTKEEYPQAAAAYAREDAAYTLGVYMAQTEREISGNLSVKTESFQLAKSFALQLLTAWGVEVDQDETDAMEKATEAVLEETRVEMERVGFIRPEGNVGEPYAADLPIALETLGHKPINWTPYKEQLRAVGVRFKKGGAVGSADKKVFQAYLEKLYKKHGMIPERTKTGTIKCDNTVQAELAELDPVMAVYKKRQALGKIHGQMIPALRSGAVVHPSYDAMKETGRTSSYDGGKFGGKRVFPSVNIQQIPNRVGGMDPRACFKPRDGRVFIDADFTALELACVGEVTLNLFGKSIHADLYNGGHDPHAYLGAQLALKSDHELVGEFSSIAGTTPMEQYEAFVAWGSGTPEQKEFYKHFRTFAKPVGLGFPGGLGPATMVNFAKATYGVEITEQEAHKMREFWRQTYPEMRMFSEWVNGQVDLKNASGDDGKYEYRTPMGMHRRGASYCAASNGMAMQSPGAEAASSGLWRVVRACYDVSQDSILYGCRPVAFIHDQVLVETTTDESQWEAQCEEVARLFSEGANVVLQSVNVRTDAFLTSVWSKSADVTRDETGRMIPWSPDAA
jgi:hypothetical protein